jgi:enoyl-CoA hydratase/carnithine racemase
MTGSDISADALARAGLRLEVDGTVTTITLDRPATKNSQTAATWLTLRAVGENLAPGTRVVVVRGEGDSFSSGLDRRMLTPRGIDGESSLVSLLTMSDGDLSDTIAAYQQGFTWLRRSDLVSIAAVQGHAIGAGFQLALACDLRVVAEDARFAMREPLLGMVPDLTGTKPLVELVGYSRALEICATGRSVGAAEARDLGLATVVVPRAELQGTVHDLVEAVTAAPYAAVTETKALLRTARALDLGEQRRLEREAQVRRLRELPSAME